MNIHAIYHRAQSAYCYAYTQDEVHLRIRTAKGDFDKVEVIYGDRYSWHNIYTKTMEKSFSDEIYDYFTVKVSIETKRLAYYFRLANAKKTVCFTEWGVKDEPTDKSQFYQILFQYPYINKCDIHEVPEWVKGAVFYQIFPERYHNGNEALNAHKTEEWGNSPKQDSFMGGDLKGITEKLGHIAELGANAVYFTPVFKATTNHKYDTWDYMEIDPHFGTKEDLKELVKKAHSLGMKVVLDAVFNHSGHMFEAFQDVVKNGEKSKYKDWFHIKSFPIEFEKMYGLRKEKGWENWYLDENGQNIQTYETFAYEPIMPKLNTENKAVKKYLLGVAEYWIKEFDIDGWRLDVANEIDHNFWREFRRVVKNAKKDAYIVSEIWHDSTPWLMGDQHDAVMNYPVGWMCENYFASRKIKTEEFKNGITTVLMRYTQQVNEVMMNLLESHDTKRFINKCGLDYKKMLLAQAFVMTFVGAPMIYYGTEVGLSGEDDPDNRRCMVWEKDQWNSEVYDRIKKLIKIRNENEALKKGSFKWDDDYEELAAFTRKTENEEVLVIINNHKKEKKLHLKKEFKNGIELLSGKNAGEIEKIEPMEIVIIKKRA